VFDNRVLRRIFEHRKKDDMAAGWRKLHKEKLHNLYASSPNVIKVTCQGGWGCVGPVARMGEMRNSYSILVGKPEGKKTTRKT